VLLITTPNPIDLNKLRIIWQSIAADSFSDKAVALTRILENVAQGIAQAAPNELALLNQEVDTIIDQELSTVNQLNRFLSEIQDEHEQHHSLNIDFSHSRAEIFSRITWAFREYLEKSNPLSKAQVLRLAETVWEKCPKGAQKAVEFWANITFIAELVEKEKVDFSEIIDTLLGAIDLPTFRKQVLSMLKTRNERTQTLSTVAPLKPDSEEESQVEKLPKIKLFSSNHQTVEIFSTSSADGTPQKRYFIRIQPQTNVTFLPLGSGRPPQRYQPGLTEVVDYPFHGICIIDEPDKIATVALNESSTNVYQIRPNEQRPQALELQQSPQLAKEHPLQLLQQEMLAEVVSWAHSQERIATPDFLISLWRAIPELAKDTNRAVHMHTIIKQLDANYTLKSSEHGSMLCERWKDLIQGIFLEGWVASSQAQQLVEQLYKSGRLSKEETQSFINTTFLADELQHLYKKWLNSSLISEQEYQMLTAQERYAVGGGCIWTLSEAIATNFADITHKQAFHEQLTKLCYQEKAKNGTISFEQFKQLVSDKLFEGNKSHPVLNQELVWEYLYSEVTGNYAAVQEALFNRVLEVVKTDALIGEAPSERKNAARQKGGKSIDTLRYRPHAQTLCIKFKQSELLSDGNPLKWYFRARNQSFDIVQQITVPLHPTNDAGLIAALETSADPDDDEFTFRQEQIQDSIYLLGLTQLILGRETPETLALGKTTEQVLEEMLDLIKTQAFPGQETPTSDLEDSARNVFIRLMDASRGQNAKQLLQSSNTYSEQRWQLASTGKKGIAGVLETFQASTPEELNRAKKQLAHMFRALMSSNTPLHEELKQDFMKLVNQYLNTSAQTEQITQLYLARLLRSKKRGVYGKHGWGGTLHVHEPFIDTLTSQDRDVLVITESFMNSEGTGELDGLVTKRTDNSLSNPTTPNNDSTNPTEFTPTGTLSTKIPLLGQPHFGSYGAQEIEVLKRSGLLTYERVALFGHSMSGNISLQGVLRAAEEILNKVDFYVFTGVVTNNEKKVSMKRFFTIVQKHPWLAEIVTASQSYQRLLKEMKIAPVISESKSDSLSQLLKILDKKDRFIQHYTGLLNFDRTAAITTSIAGGITYSVSAESTVLPAVVDAAQKLMVTAGDIIGLNQRVYSWLVENCHVEAASEHAVQLVENIGSFISHVTTILNNVKEFTPEEMTLLKERMQHFTMVFATGDKVLKYPFGVVMWEDFIDRMIFAVNDPDNPNREPGHYAHTDIAANRELIAKHMVESLHQTAYSTIIALLDAQEKTHRSTQVLPD
nr:hypothetical protein [Candidatus Woesebacteria bacterium]